MKDRTSRVVISALLLTSASGLSSQAVASGFQLQEQSASGLGVAYSGMAAATQDASTTFWNPAGMSLLPGLDASVAAQYVTPSITFNSAGGPPTGSTYNAFGNGGDAGVSSWIPALYAKTTLTPQVSVGLALNAPFGLSTNWAGEWAGMFRAIKSRVDTLNINPVVSYKVNDFLSLGAGVSYQRLRATLTQGVSPLDPTAQGRLDGSDWAWGWNVGVLLDLGQGTRVGATFRSSTDYRIDGGLSFNSPALAPLGSGAATSLRLPRVASLSVAQRLTPNLRLLADYTFTAWNSVRQLTVVGTSGLGNGQVLLNDVLNFRNSWRAGVGAEYQLNPAWLLRAGLAYDRSPVDDAFRTPRLPDNDRKWLAVGALYAPQESWSVDFGYAYLQVQDAPSQLTTAGPVPGALIGSYSLKTSVLGVQASLHF
jgi:long-chain fatty acid transport protein